MTFFNSGWSIGRQVQMKMYLCCNICIRSNLLCPVVFKSLKISNNYSMQTLIDTWKLEFPIFAWQNVSVGLIWHLAQCFYWSLSNTRATCHLGAPCGGNNLFLWRLIIRHWHYIHLWRWFFIKFSSIWNIQNSTISALLWDADVIQLHSYFGAESYFKQIQLHANSIHIQL